LKSLKRLGAVEHYLEPKLLVRLRLEDGLRPWKDKTGQHSKTLFLKYIKIIIKRKENLNMMGALCLWVGKLSSIQM
jgi:hypothetical protein